MPAFENALAVVFEAEGGLADHEADRGKRTNLGITTRTWRLWLESRGEPPRPVDEATPADARAIYRSWYWTRGKCADLPWPLSLVHFDGCVNHGVLAQNKLLQRSLGVVVDGVVGPITLGEAGRGDPQERAETLIWARMAKYRSILMADHSQRAFAAGWIGRMIDLRAVVVGDREIPRAEE